MDTPLVKILLIAAAIAITVGVVVLAWGIFNDSTGDVAEGSDVSVTDRPIRAGDQDTFPAGPSAAGLRQRLDNELSCERAGYHWFNRDTDSFDKGSGSSLRREVRWQGPSNRVPDGKWYVYVDFDGMEIYGRTFALVDNPQTPIDESGTHCALSADTYSEETGLVKRIALYVHRSGSGTAQGWHLFIVHGPDTPNTIYTG